MAGPRGRTLALRDMRDLRKRVPVPVQLAASAARSSCPGIRIRARPFALTTNGLLKPEQEGETALDGKRLYDTVCS